MYQTRQKYKNTSLLWSHISTKLNPADLASRETKSQELLQAKLWWQGSPFLLQSPDEWPPQPHQHSQELPEERAVITTLSTSAPQTSLWEGFGSFKSLLSVLSWCWRFIQCCRTLPNKRILTDLHLTSEEKIEQTRILLFRLSQQDSFNQQYQQIQDMKPLHLHDSLTKLYPFLDENGLLRVGGCLNRSDLRNGTNTHLTSELVMKWDFIPARAHFGGLWEAGVRQMKVQLRKLMGPLPNLHLSTLYNDHPYSITFRLPTLTSFCQPHMHI